VPQDHGTTGGCAPAEAAHLVTTEPVGGRALVDRVGEIRGEPADLDVADEQGEALVLLVVDGPGVVRIEVRVEVAGDVGDIEHLHRLTVSGWGDDDAGVELRVERGELHLAAPFVVLPGARLAAAGRRRRGSSDGRADGATTDQGNRRRGDDMTK